MLTDPTHFQSSPPLAETDPARPDGTIVQSIGGAERAASASDTSVGLDPPGYDLVRELGRGGMGVVYLARHRATGDEVALKTLQRLTPAGLYRFKQEFRVVAGLAHRNLVGLRELVADGDNCFFTMERVDGADPVDYVGGDPDRARAVVRQLAAGVAALHAAGVLHRDVKPGNALVTADGRVVLLDFGLAGERPPGGERLSGPDEVCGTPAYMAPEQAAGAAVGPPADWYAVGAVLYQLLAGRLPFAGTAGQMMAAKQQHDPPPPSDICPGVPADLDALCVELLSRDPARRPDAAEVLRRLGGPADQPVGRTVHRLVGRDGHLRTLDAAFAAARSGRAVVVRVSGPSGSGKTALVRAFLDRVEAVGTVPLAGRCYEQELVPYKAFDGVVDALAEYLSGRPPADAAAVLPRDTAALARLFPVLGRVSAVAAAPVGGLAADQREARRRGTAALRELLARLGDRRPVAVLIDDLQWGDADSAALLDELLRPPDPPAVLFLLCYRGEDAASPVLAPVVGLRPVPPAVEVTDLPVAPLAPAEAAELAAALLGGADPDRAAAVAREAGGNPFYVGELAEAARAGLAAGGGGLDKLLWDRSRGLPADAARLLDLAAVAGRPVRADVARAAVGPGADFAAAQLLLRSRRLLRGSGLADADTLAPYHDRVRESVLAHLPAEAKRDCHRRLAAAAEAVGDLDPEFLAVHHHAAGDARTAGRYYAWAAAGAEAATAFDQAARLYRLALELGAWPGAEAARLRADLGTALANAGRGAEAAREYLAAAAGADPDHAFEWFRRAAEQYLNSGHIDDGLDVLRGLVRSVGLAMPERPFWTKARLVWAKLRLRLRGVRFRPRPAAELSVDRLRRIDLCWSASTGMSAVDFVRGAYFQTRGLLHALRAGEPDRVACFLAMEAGHEACLGWANRRRALRLSAAAASAGGASADAYTAGFVVLGHGFCEFLIGQYGQAVETFDRAIPLLRSAQTNIGQTWALDTANTWLLWSLCYRGRTRRLAELWPVLLREAWDRGDLYMAVNLSTFIMSAVRLAADEPDRAWDDLRAAMARWSQSGFHVQRHNELIATVSIHLYQDDGPAAWAFVRDKEVEYRHAQLWLIQQIRIDYLQLRGRAAVAASRHAANPAPLLRSAERDARRLIREAAPWGRALGALLTACVADARGRGSADLFATAAEQLEAVDLGAYAAAARYRQGEQTGGDEGRALREAAVRWLAEQGVQNPRKLIRSHAPLGRPEAAGTGASV